MLDKAEIWAQKYPHAHPMWFGSFSAFLVITDPDYAKVLLARGGERLWLQLWSSIPSLQISHASLKIYSRAGFLREVFLQKSSQGMERDPPLHAVPWVFQAQGCRADLTPSPLLENQTSSNAP